MCTREQFATKGTSIDPELRARTCQMLTTTHPNQPLG